MSEFRKRILEPLAIPVTAVMFIGGLVWGMSRFLLVTDKDMAVVIAFVVSFMILIVAAFMANGTFGNAQKVALALLGIGIAGGGTVAAATLGLRPIEGHVPPADTVLVAKGITFLEKQIALKPDKAEFNVELDNQDAGTPHNFALYKDDKHTQEIFKGKQFPGPGREPNVFKNPGAGRYFYQCDVHPIPNMQGILAIGTPPPAVLPGESPVGTSVPHPMPTPTGSPTAGLILALPLLRRRTTQR
jgi:plastocyanin